MAERDEVRCPFRPHDAGDPRHAQSVALGHLTGAQQLDDLAGQQHPPGGGGGADADVLGRHVDHPRGPGLVQMGELTHSLITCTSAPAGTSVTSSGTTIRASAEARAASWWEPCPRNGVTSPPGSSTPAQERPLALGRAHRPGDPGGDRLGRPGGQSTHPAERRPYEKHERDERRDGVAGQREDRHLVVAHDAEALGHAGLHGDLLEAYGAERREGLLDRLVGAHGDAAAGDDGVGPEELGVELLEEGRRVVAHGRRPEGVGARFEGGGGQREAVGVPDLAGAERKAGLDQLGAGGEHDDPRPGAGQHAAAAHSGDDAELGGADQRAGLQHDRAGGHVLARVPDGVADLDRTIDRTETVPPSVHSTGTTASAPAGRGPPVMIRMV